MTDDVRTALRALATDDPRPGSHDAVRTATDALEDATDAAAFVASDGLTDLRRAIAESDRRGDRVRARRGRAALATLERCRRVARDHFHSGHGTVLGDGGEGRDE